MLVFWLGEATVASVELLDRLCRAQRERHPQGASGVHILVPGKMQLPTAEARAALVRMNIEYASWIGAIALVLAGRGFLASAIRSVVTATRVLGSREFELRILSSITEVIEWLPAIHFEKTGVKIERDELLQAWRQAHSMATADVT